MKLCRGMLKFKGFPKGVGGGPMLPIFRDESPTAGLNRVGGALFTCAGLRKSCDGSFCCLSVIVVHLWNVRGADCS